MRPASAHRSPPAPSMLAGFPRIACAPFLAALFRGQSGYDSPPVDRRDPTPNDGDGTAERREILPDVVRLLGSLPEPWSKFGRKGCQHRSLARRISRNMQSWITSASQRSPAGRNRISTIRCEGAERVVQGNVYHLWSQDSPSTKLPSSSGKRWQ
jgi:hypothetical protein